MHGRSVLIELQQPCYKLIELVKTPTVRWCYHTQKNILHNRHATLMPTPTESLIFPAIEPYSTGWIGTSSKHNIYYEECGNPYGVPIVVIHGGPGSGCSPGQRRFFDPAYYRVILFDQRGCGRSEPAGCIEENTTQDLVEDIEKLRHHLKLDHWFVFGGSWGSTLALAYAAKYPEFISGLILRGIFLARPAELDWFLYKVRSFFPEPWEELVQLLEIDERQDILASFHRRIFNGDDASLEAAIRWNGFEASIMTLLPSEPSATPPSDTALMGRARVQLHYLINHCFLLDTPLLGQIDRVRHIPAIIIQGRYDMVCPPISAYELHSAWPEADFRIIQDAGHAAFEPGIAAALIAATESFKSIVRSPAKSKDPKCHP